MSNKKHVNVFFIRLHYAVAVFPFLNYNINTMFLNGPQIQQFNWSKVYGPLYLGDQTKYGRDVKGNVCASL